MTAITSTDALRMIRDGRLPCEVCGKVHEPRTISSGLAPQWSDPIDGHGYRQPDVRSFAARVLDGDSGSRCTGDPCTCTNGIGCVNVPVDQW